MRIETIPLIGGVVSMMQPYAGWADLRLMLRMML
ncbi:hypothetical protein BQ8482_180267 [Mesorhizobium delmotii]|uniref:Uncharacterized protein n=1 Tax=Mesorhizobium delmotii TaxID=1631247 RepID=A0A2P9AIT5_9HYPH|nr:hypothetical protein BQ8482_180267 [Mesorhizobium delmotii]